MILVVLAGFRKIYSNTNGFAGWRFQTVTILKTLIWQFWASPRHIFYYNNKTSLTNTWKCKQLHLVSSSIFKYTFLLSSNMYLKFYLKERTCSFATSPSPLSTLIHKLLSCYNLFSLGQLTQYHVDEFIHLKSVSCFSCIMRS